VVLNWNAGAERLKGYSAAEIVGRHFSTFYPDDDVAAGKPARELEVAERDGRVTDEGWRVRKDGGRFWASVVITAVRGDSGALIGFAKITRDLTERRASEEQARHLAAERAAHAEAEQQREALAALNEQLQQQAIETEAQTEEAQALAEELEMTNEQLAEALAETEAARAASVAAERFANGVLAGITDPFVVHDAAWRFRYINPSAAQLFTAIRGEDLLGRNVWSVFPEIVGTPLHAAMTRAHAERVSVAEEAFAAERGVWSEVHSYPLPDGGVATWWRDVSARKRADEATHYLSEASAILGSSLDYETTLAAVARLVVPQLADWSTVDVVGENGAIRRLAVAHVDPAKIRLATELEERYPADPDSGVPRVVRTGEPHFIPDVTDELLVAGARDEEHLRIVRALGLRSAMVVPLIARDTVLGAITLVSAESARRYTEADLALAQELARRAAMAVENARLHRSAILAREAAEQAAIEAARANRAKAEFLTVMSHELRTPLNAIDGYAELIELGIHGPVTPAQLEALGRIRHSERHLLSLINDVLNFAKLAAGRVDIVPERANVVSLLSQIEPLVAPQIRAKRIDYTCAAPPADLHALADGAKVVQILLNLLSNAIKFTAAGGRIEVGAERRGTRVALWVRDTGIGIGPDRLTAVFEPFVQITRDLTSAHEGTGLGLAISRDLAQLMGGDLLVESEPGVGSTFTLVVAVA
jgi:PAS domain S-box-containing protein